MHNVQTSTSVIIVAPVGEYITINDLDRVIILDAIELDDAAANIDLLDSTIYPVAKEDLEQTLSDAINLFIRVFPGSGDDDYFDYVPDLFYQIQQLAIHLVDYQSTQPGYPTVARLLSRILKHVKAYDSTEDFTWEEVKSNYELQDYMLYYIKPELQEYLVKTYNEAMNAESN